MCVCACVYTHTNTPTYVYTHVKALLVPKVGTLGSWSEAEVDLEPVFDFV
jgi:hypothetical protein